MVSPVPVPATTEARDRTMRVLVPMDDSRGSTSALELALWIADRGRAGRGQAGAPVELEVVHVVPAASGRWIEDLAGLFGLEPALASRKLAARMEERGKQVIDRAIERCRAMEIPAAGSLETGNVVQSIARRAARTDLIILGLRGESGDRFPWHEAGTTERIVARVPVSTLVAPDTTHRIDAIALGYDGSEGSRRALAATARLAQITNVPVHVLAVGHPAIDFGEVIRELSTSGIAYTTHHAGGDPREVLPAEAKRLGCNVLALGYRGRSQLKDTFLGRTTEWLIGKVDMGLLVAR